MDTLLLYDDVLKVIYKNLTVKENYQNKMILELQDHDKVVNKEVLATF